MKVNFRRFPVYQGISKKNRITMDIAEPLANCIYSSVPGIAAHCLSEKIYKSEGETDITPEELVIIRDITAHLSGMYLDSINDHINELENGSAQ